jgi:hypothetical protein
VKSRFRAPKKMPNSASVTAMSSVGSNVSRKAEGPSIRRRETETAFSWSAMYGIIPHTTSAATSVPSGADLP